MIKKPTKSISGVLPLTVVTKPLGWPKSYTPESPAILRASMLNYDPYKQVKVRLKVLRIMKHITNKIELIIIGGTFLENPIEYQYYFIKSCYDALNNKKARSLKEAKKINERANNRVIALCLETRPDACDKEKILHALEFGTTRIELGVQAIDNKILKIVNGGHDVKAIINATLLLKDSGFKIGYHFMPGLPGSSAKKDLAMYKKIFSDEKFKPDQIKIYPTQVIKGSKLEELYTQDKYLPYSKEELIELLIKMKLITPRYCRIMRVMREIPKQWLVAGVLSINLRQEIRKEMQEKGLKCGCIRCREIGFVGSAAHSLNDLKIKITKYNASKGKEFFIEAVDSNDVLFGLARLRFPYRPFVPELEDKAIVRELYVYGRALSITQRAKPHTESSLLAQHKGIGKLLLETAESIAKQNYDSIAVISGVGVREYYRKLGYMLVGRYMIKSI